MGGAAVTEDTFIIHANIARYEAMLMRDLSDEKRSEITRQLGEVEESLVVGRRMRRTG